MSILAQLQALQSEYDKQQKIGKEAVSAYQQLQPQYNERLTAAQQYQPKVSDAYSKFTQSYNTAVGQYNQQLKSRYQTYQSVAQRGQALQSQYQSALQTVQSLQGQVSQREAEKNRLYSAYTGAFSTAQSQAQNRYQDQLRNLQTFSRNFQTSAQGYLSRSQTSQQEANRAKSAYDAAVSNPLLSSRTFVFNNQVWNVPENNFYARYQTYDIRTGQLQTPDWPAQYAARFAFTSGQAKTAAQSALDLYRQRGISYADYVNFSNLVGQQRTIRDENLGAYNQFSQLATEQAARYQQDLARSQSYQTQYQALLADRDYVNRVATQASAAAQQAYEQYVSNQYNPSVNQLNQYINQTYNPALSSYQQFANSTELQSARQSYETLAADKGYVDRASQSQRAAYESALSEYKNLQARYQELEPQLGEYTTQMQTAAGRIKQIEAELPALQKSLAVEQDPRKRETRIGYGRSLLTGGTKRASSAR